MAAKKKTWQQRRAEHLKAAIHDIENRPKGESVNKAIPRIAAKYNGRNLPGRKNLELSPATLKRIWFAWKKYRSDAVFDLHYRPPQTETAVQPWVRTLFTGFAAAQGISIPQAYNDLKESCPDLPFSMRTLRRHLSADELKEISGAIALRNKLDRLGREIEAINKGVNQ
jgi:hypothetical protein